MDKRNGDLSRLTESLRAAGLSEERGDKPLTMTEAEAAAFKRDEIVAQITYTSKRHPEFDDFSDDATYEELAQGMREMAEGWERGDFREEAARCRAQARAIESRIALERHGARSRPVRTPGLRRVPHGGRRRTGAPIKRRSSSSRGSPSSDPDLADGEPPGPPPEEPGGGGFELGHVDRWPLLWRFRSARCHWHEWREGWPE